MLSIHFIIHFNLCSFHNRLDHCSFHNRLNICSFHNLLNICSFHNRLNICSFHIRLNLDSGKIACFSLISSIHSVLTQFLLHLEMVYFHPNFTICAQFESVDQRVKVMILDLGILSLYSDYLPNYCFHCVLMCLLFPF